METNDDDLERIRDEIERYLNADPSRLSFSEFDGLITAVLSGPDVVPPSAWIEFVSGDGPRFETAEEVTALFERIMRWYNHRALGLLNEGTFIPALDEQRHGRKRIVDPTGWCSGYLAGVALQDLAWMPFLSDDDTAAMLAPIFVFGQEFEEDDLEVEQEFEELRRAIPSSEREGLIGDAVVQVYNYWLARRTQRPAANRPTRPKRRKRR